MLTTLFGDPKDLADKLPGIKFITGTLGDNNFDYGGFVTVLILFLGYIAVVYTNISVPQVFSIVIALTPIWLTYFLFMNFFDKWMEYTGKKFGINQGRTTLRIKLPQEVTKSPEAMEFVLAQIHNTANPDNLMQTYLDGKRPLAFSLEIASIGGDVRFYINIPTKKTKAAFEANLYAQYPGVEIIEEPVDYAAEIPLGSDEWDVMSFHMGKKKEAEKAIKTYIDYNLDKNPKEEEKLDPITPMLEVFGSIAPHERLYVQYQATSFRPDKFTNGQLTLGEGPDWNANIPGMIDKIMKREGAEDQDEAEAGAAGRITPGERSAIETLERHSTKYAYNVAIRWMYLVKKGRFNGDLINPVIRSFSQFDVIGRNQIGVRWRTDLDYKDLVPGSYKRIDGLKQQEFKEYKLRKFFPKNGAGAPKIFTVEELASVWHLPGQVAITPSLGRVPSTRSEAPTNLPTGDLPT